MRNLLIILLFLSPWSLSANASTPILNDWVVTGEASMKKWDFDQAIFFFSKAIEENPMDVEAYLLRSKAYLIVDRYHESTQDYRTALSIDQDFVHLFMQGKKKKGKTGMLLTEDFNKELPLNKR